jgi:REP element-mobilizing transposase RayT
MPNHVHGIIVTANNEHLNGNENNNGRGLIYQTQNKMQTHDRIQTQKGSVSNQGLINQTPTKWILMQNSKQTLGKIVRYLKARTSKLVHDGGDSHFQWQRNYYEHVIRNEEDMNRIREYIETNPARWEEDNENPKRRGDSVINVGARHAVPPPHEQTEQFCRPVAEDGENRSPFLGWDQGSIHGR